MAAVVAAQTRRVSFAFALLHLLALFADCGLQGPAHAVAVSPVLRRSARPGLYRQVCRFSPALFNEYPALLASGAALPLRRAQRRNQHHRFQSSLAARQRARNSSEANRWLVVSPPGRKRQRFREL